MLVMTEPQRRPEGQRTILLIGSDTTIRRIVSRVLQQEAIQVVPAENIQTAYPIIRQEQPGLIVLDIGRGEEPLTVCQTLRRMFPQIKTPIMLLLAREKSLTIQQLRLVGITSALVKPFVSAELIKAVRKYVTKEE